MQMPKFAALWGQLIVFMGSFTLSLIPQCMILLIFLTIIWQNRWRCAGVVSVRHSASRIGCRKSRRHIRALRRDFVDQLSPIHH